MVQTPLHVYKVSKERTMSYITTKTLPHLACSMTLNYQIIHSNIWWYPIVIDPTKLTKMENSIWLNNITTSKRKGAHSLRIFFCSLSWVRYLSRLSSRWRFFVTRSSFAFSASYFFFFSCFLIFCCFSCNK